MVVKFQQRFGIEPQEFTIRPQECTIVNPSRKPVIVAFFQTFEMPEADMCSVGYLAERDVLFYSSCLELGPEGIHRLFVRVTFTTEDKGKTTCFSFRDSFLVCGSTGS